MSELSETSTDQRRTPNCGYHARAKVIVQNVFQFLTPSKVDSSRFNANNCNRYVDYDNYKNNVKGLTAEQCSTGGYDRILQFLYIYYLIDEGIATKADLFGNISDIISVEKIPAFFNSAPQRDYLIEMIKKVCRAKDAANIEYQTATIRFNIPDSFEEASQTLDYFSKPLFEIVKACVSKGMYVKINVTSHVKKDNDKHGLHALHIVSTYRDEIIVKNSWGDKRVYQTKINETFWLKDSSAYFIYQFDFLLPFQKGVRELSSFKLTPLPSERDESNRKLHDFLQQITLLRPDTVPKELRDAPIFHRGDAVSYNGTPFIFMDYIRENAILYPNRRVPFVLLKRCAIQTVPDAVKHLTVVAQQDEKELKDQTKKVSELVKLLKRAKSLKEDINGHIHHSTFGQHEANAKQSEIASLKRKLEITPAKESEIREKIEKAEKTLVRHKERVAKHLSELAEKQAVFEKDNLKKFIDDYNEIRQKEILLKLEHERKHRESSAALKHAKSLPKSSFTTSSSSSSSSSSAPAPPPGFKIQEYNSDREMDHELLRWAESMNLKTEDDIDTVWKAFDDNHLSRSVPIRVDFLKYIASLLSPPSRPIFLHYFKVDSPPPKKASPERQTKKASPPKKASPERQTKKASPERLPVPQPPKREQTGLKDDPFIVD